MSELLALVDGSAYSQSVCDHAAWAAGRLGRGVTVAHILGHRQGVKSDLSGNIGLGARTALLEELAELDKAKAQLAHKRGRAILEDAKARIEGQGVDRVETRLRNGDLVETLRSLEAEAEMVLVGKRGEAADFAKLHLGSNLERVARSTARPLLVCARGFRPVRRAILAFDGGTSAMKAVDHVARSPLLAETRLTVLTAGADTTAARRQIEGAAAQLRGGGIAVDTVIEAGQPDEVIARRIEAGEADIVVMGAFNHTRLRSFIIGSTTAEIVRSCQVPILLFR